MFQGQGRRVAIVRRFRRLLERQAIANGATQGVVLDSLTQTAARLELAALHLQELLEKCESGSDVRRTAAQLQRVVEQRDKVVQRILGTAATPTPTDPWESLDLLSSTQSPTPSDVQNKDL